MEGKGCGTRRRGKGKSGVEPPHSKSAGLKPGLYNSGAAPTQETDLKIGHHKGKEGTMFRLLPGIFDIVPLQLRRRR